MPEKFFYTFLIFFIFSLTSFLSQKRGSRPELWMNKVSNIFLWGMIISAICWIWS